MVGRELLGEHGYQEFSMRTVAARCGIGVGTLYNYYASKQQLVTDILRSEWDVHLRRMLQVARSDQPEITRLEGVFVELSAFVQGRHSVMAAEFPETVDCNEIRGVLTQRAMVRQQVVSVVGSILQHRPEDLQERMADGIARVFLSYASDAAKGRDAVRWILEKLLA